MSMELNGKKYFTVEEAMHKLCPYSFNKATTQDGKLVSEPDGCCVSQCYAWEDLGIYGYCKLIDKR